MPPPLSPQVNLLPSDEPQDVYAGVRSLVAQKISDDAEAEASDDAKAEGQRQLAMKLVGLITRKVVKQTVMTSVYGVTFIGAKRQIENRLHELADLKYEELPRAEQNLLSTYVARLTLDSLGEVRAGTLRSSLYNQTPPLPPYFPTAPLAAPSTPPLIAPSPPPHHGQVFTGATDAMRWLDNAAAAIATASGKSVAWTMPLGLPVMQPYYKPQIRRVRTILGRLNLQREMDEEDDTAVVDTRKQRSAFSPNYIHSLDSAHMMKTAIACRKRGLVFAAVHDSYWTHPSDVDEMNVVLRDKFVELHSGDLLEQLITSFRRDFPEVEWDADPALALPPRGDLDLEEVKKSIYFFA